MTKAELIHFLQPFSDEIRIVTTTESSATVDATASYEIAKDPFRTSEGLDKLGIEEGEGFINID